MCLLLETIRFEQGAFHNMPYHQARFDAARAKFFPQAEPIFLHEVLLPPLDLTNRLYRCRVLYAEEIQSVTFMPQEKRSFQSLQLVHAEVDYAYKFADRQCLDLLLAQKGSADEVLIVKSGLVTDCTIGNLVFKKEGKLYTPAEALLPGTQRECLINRGLIQPQTISYQDILSYESVGIINALIDLPYVSWINVRAIRF